MRVDRLSRLELDVDCRLADLWSMAADIVHPDVLDPVGRLMRAAYAQGYVEAAKGDTSLFTEYGYAVP